MNIEQKRVVLKNAYSGTKWSDKVDNLSDEAVTAIYIRLKGQGRV